MDPLTVSSLYLDDGAGSFATLRVLFMLVFCDYKVRVRPHKMLPTTVVKELISREEHTPFKGVFFVAEAKEESYNSCH